MLEGATLCGQDRCSLTVARHGRTELRHAERHAELLAMNLWGCGLWVAASYVLYRKRVFLAL